MTTAPARRPAPPFGTVPAPVMVVSEAVDGVFSTPRAVPVAPLELHPFAHVLHYGSACFEGLKAHRGVDGVVRLFRVDRHVARLRRSSALVHLPVPDAGLVEAAIHATVAANLEVVPDPPGALYLRPLLIGTEPNIGSAASPSATALLTVLASPVGDYFADGERALRLAVETVLPRTTPQFGEAKAGANYVLALGVIRHARAAHGADQVLFAPDGLVQETGAANFLLLDEGRVVTPALDPAFLHGVTRDTVLTLARDLGDDVEEREVRVEELTDWSGEAAVSGTAAVLTGVGHLVLDGRSRRLGDGQVGAATRRLRTALLAVQRGEVGDAHGWTRPVTG